MYLSVTDKTHVGNKNKRPQYTLLESYNRGVDFDTTSYWDNN